MTNAERVKAWRIANPEKWKASQDKWKASNKEHVRLYAHVRYYKDKPTSTECKQNSTNTITSAERSKAWRIANPDKSKASMARYRAKLKQNRSSKVIVRPYYIDNDRKIFYNPD